MLRSHLFALTLAAAAIVGCRPNTPGNADTHFKTGGGIHKAAFDLNCPTAMLQVIDLGDGGIGVRGCGRQARYQYTETGWVLNAIGDGPTPPAPSPYPPGPPPVR